MRVHAPGMFTTALILVLSSASMLAEEKELTLKSPDGALVMRFATRAAKGSTAVEGRLVYSLAVRGKPVLEESALGLDLDGAAPLGSSVYITGSDAGDGVDDYTLATGKTSHVHEEYRSLTLRVAENGPRGRALTIEARAYNDGVAFRYVLPEQRPISELRLRQEATEFHFRDRKSVV